MAPAPTSTHASATFTPSHSVSSAAPAATTSSGTILTPGAIAGITIGSLAGAVFVFFLIGCVVNACKRKKLKEKRNRFNGGKGKRWPRRYLDEENSGDLDQLIDLKSNSKDQSSSSLPEPPKILAPPKKEKALPPSTSALKPNKRPGASAPADTNIIGLAVSPEIGGDSNSPRTSSERLLPTKPASTAQPGKDRRASAPRRPILKSRWNLSVDANNQTQIERQHSPNPPHPPPTQSLPERPKQSSPYNDSNPPRLSSAEAVAERRRSAPKLKLPIPIKISSPPERKDSLRQPTLPAKVTPSPSQEAMSIENNFRMQPPATPPPDPFQSRPNTAVSSNTGISDVIAAYADRSTQHSFARSSAALPEPLPLHNLNQEQDNETPPSFIPSTPSPVPKLSRSRSSSSSSDASTTFDFSSDDETPPEHTARYSQTLPESPVDAGSPINSLAYPKIPRPANQAVARSPPMQQGGFAKAPRHKRDKPSIAEKRRGEQSATALEKGLWISNSNLKSPPLHKAPHHQQGRSWERHEEAGNSPALAKAIPSRGSSRRVPPSSFKKPPRGSMVKADAYSPSGPPVPGVVEMASGRQPEMAMKGTWATQRSPVWEPNLVPKRAMDGSLVIEIR